MAGFINRVEIGEPAGDPWSLPYLVCIRVMTRWDMTLKYGEDYRFRDCYDRPFAYNMGDYVQYGN